MSIGYHKRKINKGVLGQASKIIEEVAEYEDAIEQKSVIMAMVELSDIYGALEALAETHHLTMEDLKSFSDITKRAFKNGFRKND